MKLNNFLTGALLCALVAGFVSCSSNNPTDGPDAVALDFDMIKVCEACKGKTIAQVKEIMKPYNLKKT